MKWYRTSSGQSLIELLLAIGLAAILLPALVAGLIASRQGRAQQQQRFAAIELLKEAQEVTRSVRERGWTTFAVNGTYHPVLSGSQWTLASGSETTASGFTRQIVISDVSRNPAMTGPIVTSGGTLDPSTKKVTITVSWGVPYTTSVTSTQYMTRYLDNNGHVDTTDSEFKYLVSGVPQSVFTNTATTNTAGGEVILGAGGGGGDWCQPSKQITAIDLPKSGVANAITATASTSGSVVFAGTGENSSGVSFAKVPLVGDNPPSGAVAATFDGYKTNAVFGEANYAYLGTDNNSKEVVIMSLTQYSNPPTNSKYLEVSAVNLPGNTNGNSIYVANNIGYFVGGNKLYIYTLAANRTSSTLQNGTGLTLSGTGKKVLVSGNYAFIATNATTNNLQIVNISNPASPSITGQLTLGTSQAGVDLYVNSAGDRVYFVTAYSSGKKDFYIINTSNKASPATVGTGYDTSGMSPTGVTVVTGNRAIVVGTGGTYQYQVINITNESGPALCSPTSQLQYATGIYGVASVLQSNGFAYSYIITGDANAELKIILGGAGGQYSSAGTFVSGPFDAGTTTLFNRFDATFSQPSQTTIGFQIAVANAVSGSCTGASYTFIGPSLTSSSTDVYATGSAIPIYSSGNFQNPGRCFKYKVYYTSSDVTQTPVLEDFTINYSP